MAKNFIDWTRVVMNENTNRLIEELNPSSLDVLEISGRHWKKQKRFNSYRCVYYPEFDVCELPDESEKYDLIIAEQVFEHVRYPARGLQTVKKLLRKNGYFLITTPFLIKVHGSPVDYWRWTEEGMRYFLEDNEFTIKSSGSWGNKDCVIAYLNFESIDSFDNSKCSLHNEKDSPVVVWALAQK